jgi:hypothetical protein
MIINNDNDNSNKKEIKRLYKSDTDKILCGVCFWWLNKFYEFCSIKFALLIPIPLNIYFYNIIMWMMRVTPTDWINTFIYSGWRHQHCLTQLPFIIIQYKLFLYNHLFWCKILLMYSNNIFLSNQIKSF